MPLESKNSLWPAAQSPVLWPSHLKCDITVGPVEEGKEVAFQSQRLCLHAQHLQTLVPDFMESMNKVSDNLVQDLMKSGAFTCTGDFRIRFYGEEAEIAA